MNWAAGTAESSCGDGWRRVRQSMQNFRVFYFRKNVLHHSEELQVRDILDAVDLARSSEPDVRAEIWSDRGKVGIVGPTPGQG